MLLKHLLELLCLLDIRLEAYHFENASESFVVDALVPICLSFVNTCFQIKDLFEVFAVHLGDARLVR